MDNDVWCFNINLVLYVWCFNINLRTHKAITDLIYEMIELRAENNKLKAQATLRDLYITSLQTKKAPVVETAEKIESLRQKLAEVHFVI